MPTSFPILYYHILKTNLTPSAVGYIRALPSAISSPHPPRLADRASVSPSRDCFRFLFFLFFLFYIV